MSSCRCQRPRQSADPRSTGVCAECGARLSPGVLSSEETVGWFFDRLESALPGKTPVDFLAFRSHCEERERSGRQDFGLRYLTRDNLSEGNEEAADLAIYVLLDVLQSRQRTGEDTDLDVALTAAYHAYMADRALRLLASKRRGGP